MIVAGSPVQNGSYTECLAQHVAHHILWPHSFRRAFIMTAAGGVNMMVSRIPAAGGRIDPPPQRKIERGVDAGAAHGDRSCLRDVFGAAAARHRVLGRWKA